MQFPIDDKDNVHHRKLRIFDLGQEDSIFLNYYNVRETRRVEDVDES